QLATEGSGVGTWDIDLISGSGFWSPQGAALLGAGRLQFSAQDWTEALHPADRAAAAEAWRKAVEESAPYEVQFRGTAPGPDGIECWVLSRGRIERDASGKPVRGAGVMVDI